MQHKFDSSKMNRLERPERYQLYRPAELLRQFGLKIGMTCVDIGCGTGFFTTKALELVGDTGKVYAMDIEDQMLAYVKQRQLKGPLEVIQNEENVFPLPDKLADVAVMGLVLHEAIDKPSFLNEAARILKPNGVLIGLEWKKIEETKGPEKQERLNEEEIIALLKQSGFEAITVKGWTDSHYVFKGNIKE
jgi:ubiquinone/menaquinone biosynthesis C-methylase UbiE